MDRYFWGVKWIFRIRFPGDLVLNWQCREQENVRGIMYDARMLWWNQSGGKSASCMWAMRAQLCAGLFLVLLLLLLLAVLLLPSFGHGKYVNINTHSLMFGVHIFVFFPSLIGWIIRLRMLVSVVMLCVLYYHVFRYIVMEVMITVAFAVGIVADQDLVLNQIKCIQL